MTSPTIIQFLREQFSRHGIPDIIVSDNGLQLVSHEFRWFTEVWEFKHVTSSLHHHKANGEAESAVKVTKNLFKKALWDIRDPWLALLEHRNMPVETIGSSPARRLMFQRTKILMPTASTLFCSQVVEVVKRLNSKCRKKTTITIGQHTHYHNWKLDKRLEQHLQLASNTAQKVPSEVAKEQSVNAVPDPKGNSPNLTDPATCTSSDPVSDIPPDPVPAMPTKCTRTRVMKLPKRFNGFVTVVELSETQGLCLLNFMDSEKLFTFLHFIFSFIYSFKTICIINPCKRILLLGIWL